MVVATSLREIFGVLEIAKTFLRCVLVNMNAPPAVRILPLNRKDFRQRTAAKVQKEYFKRELPELNGRFYFYEKGLRVSEGAVVLFQFDKKIIASAVFVDSQHYSKPKWRRCWGHLDFEPSSIRTFEPVDLGSIQKIWPEVTSFGRAKWALNPAGYRAFRRLTLRGATIAESIVDAVRTLVGGEKKTVFTRDAVRKAAGVDRSWWNDSWSPIFQGMRADESGGAPPASAKHRGLFRSVAHGKFVLTARGWSLVCPEPQDDGRHGEELKRIAQSLEENDYFDENDERDEREKRKTEIAQRRGQPAFRRKLLNAYEHECAVSEGDAVAALEAAHITRFLGEKSNHVSNGILLRSDIHTLFDLDLIGIHPTKLTVAVSSALAHTDYKRFVGKKIFEPDDPSKRLSRGALKRRWRAFKASAS